MTGEGVPTPCQYCTADVRYSKCTSAREASLCDNYVTPAIDPLFPAAVFEHDLFPPPASKVPAMGTRVNEMQHLLSKIGCSCLAQLPVLQKRDHSDDCAQVLASRVSELLRGMA